MHKTLVFHRNQCTGCRYCEIVCSFKHKSVCGRAPSLIRIITDDRGMHTNAALFCHHCKRPLCVELCPVDAIRVNGETGLVGIDSTKCTGCGLCLECPLGGIRLDDDSGLAINCNLCNGKPACVEFCPSGALRYASPADARKTKFVTKA